MLSKHLNSICKGIRANYPFTQRHLIRPSHRFFSTENESKQGMSKEELEKLAEIQKMIRTQNFYKIAGASRSLNIWSAKIAKLLSALFLLWLFTPEIATNSEGKTKIRLLSKKVSLVDFGQIIADLPERISI